VSKYYLLAIFLFFSLSCATITTEVPPISAETAEPLRAFTSISSRNFEHLEGLQNFVKPVQNSFSVNFGPRLLQLQASYLEKREQAANSEPGLQDVKLRRYVNLLGTTSFGGSSLTGEGELTYSPRDSLINECNCSDWPRIMRVGIRSRWQGFSYGASLKSIEKGFISSADATIGQARDEGHFWGEYNLGPFNIRGTVGESWEELLDFNRLRVTKAAATAIKLDRSVWGGTFSSSYGLVEQGPRLNQDLTVITNTLSGFYRPIHVLSFGPSFGIKEEWDANTGMRTEMPTTEFSFVYTPFKNEFRFMGGTSFTRTFNNYGLSDVRTLGTRAIVDWKPGKFLGRNDTLSFNLNYNRQRDGISSGNSHDDLSGILQLKIADF